MWYDGDCHAFLFFFFPLGEGGVRVGYCSSHFVESIMWSKFPIFHLFSFVTMAITDGWKIVFGRNLECGIREVFEM